MDMKIIQFKPEREKGGSIMKASEKQILFSTEMVRAILEGRKTMTRRVIKPPKKADGFYITSNIDGSDKWPIAYDEHKQMYKYHMPCPYGEPGTILWVRETWDKYSEFGFEHNRFTAGIDVWYLYKADGKERYYRGGEIEYIPKWRPSIHMPREAARLFLRVKNVRVERLQEISEADAIAEGIKWTEEGPLHAHYADHKLGAWLNFATAKEAFANLWDSINAKRGYEWETNPWVWVIEFEKCGGGGYENYSA